jgi:hypothetical protein
LNSLASVCPLRGSGRPYCTPSHWCSEDASTTLEPASNATLVARERAPREKAPLGRCSSGGAGCRLGGSRAPVARPRGWLAQERRVDCGDKLVGEWTMSQTPNPVSRSEPRPPNLASRRGLPAAPLSGASRSLISAAVSLAARQPPFDDPQPTVDLRPCPPVEGQARPAAALSWLCGPLRPPRRPDPAARLLPSLRTPRAGPPRR